MLASNTPTTVGLYVNNFEKLPPGNPDTDPYNYLLGTDGFGASATWGNKIDNLINYMTAEGYNYALLYGVHREDFVGSIPTQGAAAEVFSASGKAILENVILRFKAANISVAAICDVFKPNQVTDRYNGTSQVRKIHDYNASVPANKRFDWINYETEFWNYRKATVLSANSTNNGTFRINNAASGLGTIDLAAANICNNQIPSFAALTSILTVGDLVEVTSTAPGWRNLQIRQIVDVGPTYLVVDRPWEFPGNLTTFPCATWTARSKSLSVVDYQTFLYRINACDSYLTSVGSTLKTEVYVGFPDYVYGEKQLASLFQTANIDRLLITDYVRIPNWPYMDGSYSRASSSAGALTWYTPIGAGYDIVPAPSANNSYKRVTDDLIPNIDNLRNIGAILSAESTTDNNSNCPTNCQDNNFSGYFFEGRSKTGILSGNNIFRPLTTAGVPTPPPPGGECCGATTLVKPEDFNAGSPFSPRSITDSWQYIVKDPMPSGAGYAPGSPKSYNEAINDGDLDDTNLKFDTLIVFTQSIMRNLVTDPPLPLLFSTTTVNESCATLNNGSITAVVSSGNPQYTYELLQGVPSVVIATIGPTPNSTATFTGLSAGLYYCRVTDITTATLTLPVVVLEPAAPIRVITTTPTNCNGGSTGSITATITGFNTSSFTFTPTEVYVELNFGPYAGTFYPLTAINGWSYTFTNIPAGTYNLKFRPSNPRVSTCDFTNTAVVNTSSPPIITNISVNSPDCRNSAKLDSVQINITGTTAPPYTYKLTINSSGVVYTAISSNTTYTFTNIPYQVIGPTDSVNVEVTDSKGCADTDNKSFNLPSQIVVNRTIISPTCSGSNNGSIDLNPTGGTPPYTYLWNTGATTDTITNLIPGTYDYTVTDGAGCSVTGTVTLNSSFSINAIYTVTQIPSGQNTGGAITLDAISGGTAPYTYSWSSGQTTPSISGLGPGIYTVTITDDNGCQITKTFSLYVECDTFDLTEFKVAIFKAQCCAGKKAKKYVELIQAGREDLAYCKRAELYFLTMAIDRIYCITDFITGCLDCETLQNILNQISKFCDCDCCEEADTNQATVQWNPITNSFDIIDIS